MSLLKLKRNEACTNLFFVGVLTKEENTTLILKISMQVRDEIQNYVQSWEDWKLARRVQNFHRSLRVPPLIGIGSI
jgi:hypothetical protein